jgi:hypothetical protein
VVNDIKREQESSAAELERTLDILRHELEKVQLLAEELRAVAMRARNAKKGN